MRFARPGMVVCNFQEATFRKQPSGSNPDSHCEPMETIQMLYQHAPHAYRGAMIPRAYANLGDRRNLRERRRR